MTTDTLNADPAELAKFSELAHRWWDPDSEFAPLHQINPLRLNWISGLAEGLAGKRVVDIGCGGGILSDSMARQGAKVLGEPRIGAHGTPIFFVHPKDMNGVLTEIMETTRGDH